MKDILPCENSRHKATRLPRKGLILPAKRMIYIYTGYVIDSHIRKNSVKIANVIFGAQVRRKVVMNGK
jgi:hypothetical protein